MKKKMKMKKMIIILILVLCLPGCAYASTVSHTNTTPIQTKEPIKQEAKQETEEQKVEETTIEPNPVPPAEIRLFAAGDNLIHSMVIKAGLKEDGTYDYHSMYKEVSDYIKQADVRVINQETVLINDPEKYSGYPTFGSPKEIGDAVIGAGFNVVTQATNHAYDKKEEGILDSIAYWENHEIPVLGIHDSMEDAEEIYVFEKNGIKISMLNYTYGLNGFILPDGKEYLVDDLNDTEKIMQDIEKAKTVSDFVIVFPHWGTEYTLKETENQQKTAQMLADSGADLIIGCHPHVIEPLKDITASDGRIVPVFYSLGNFISNQDEVPRMLGAIADVTLEKKDGKVNVKSAKMVPIVTHIESYSKDFKVYLLENYTEELAATHRMRRIKGQAMSVEKLWEIWNQVTEGK